MTDTRKFFITELSIRIFAEDAPWDGTLDWLSHDATHDEYAAVVIDQQDSEVPAELFAAMALESGIDPAFFKTIEDDPDTKGVVRAFEVTAEGVE